MTTYVTSWLKSWFGDFEREELKKFVLLGVIFALIIGIYWTLRPLKDSLFQAMVGAEWQPYAKLLSLVTVFPLVIIYSKLVQKLSRQQLFYVLSGIYGAMTLLMAYFMYDPIIGLANPVESPYRIFGWLWYVFVESFGSLVVALFWAFASDISTPDQAKKGFSLVVMVGQIGGIIAPKFFSHIPHWFNTSNATVVLILGIAIFMIIPLVKIFMTVVPKEQLVGFQHDAAEENKDEEEEPGFLEGLKLMVSQSYLLGILGIIMFFETIVTVIDYHFKFMAKAEIPDQILRNMYLSDYASWANLATFVCLILGINNVQRRLGIAVSLGLMPILVVLAVFVFKLNLGLNMLFWIMVAAKAVNYALNSPSMKQLYIPVTKEARYKSQAWIESFGSRGAKGIGSVLNSSHVYLNKFLGSAVQGTAWHIAMTSYLFFGICGVWFFVALFLAGKYKKAVAENKVIC